MDFGKFVYERAKKEREARKAQTKIEVKEIRLRPKTNEHHRDFKVRDARRWLMDGKKVKVRIRFRGREIRLPGNRPDRPERGGRRACGCGDRRAAPALEGRTMLMVLAPGKTPKKK